MTYTITDTAMDQLAINTIRTLAMDALQAGLTRCAARPARPHLL